MVIAGSDTTALTLSAFWFYIVRRPTCYTKLVDEIRTTFASLNDIYSGAALSSCTYLQACINEALRITPTGGSELPRFVLPGSLTIDGQHIPAGVQVGVAMWALTHNDDYYSDPYVFRPERWIVDPATGVTSEDVARAQEAYFPFQLGRRNCAGQKLAMLEMLITIARTLYRMDARSVPGDTLGGGSPDLPWGMRKVEHFQIRCAFMAQRDGPNVQFRKRLA
jgi:cytochrome P450